MSKRIPNLKNFNFSGFAVKLRIFVCLLVLLVGVGYFA